MRCGDCRHWSVEGYDFPRLDVGRCARAKEFWEATEWRRIGLEPPEREYKDNADLMFVQDGSDYRGDFLTRPSFGCVQFEKQEEEATCHAQQE